MARRPQRRPMPNRLSRGLRSCLNGWLTRRGSNIHIPDDALLNDSIQLDGLSGSDDLHEPRNNLVFQRPTNILKTTGLNGDPRFTPDKRAAQGQYDDAPLSHMPCSNIRGAAR